jgi:hypothetical protein
MGAGTSVTLRILSTIETQDYQRSVPLSQNLWHCTPRRTRGTEGQSKRVLVFSQSQQSFEVEAKCMTTTLYLVKAIYLLDSRYNRLYTLLLGGFGFIWAICAIECVIRWNKISGVDAIDSTGQYMPLTMGL